MPYSNSSFDLQKRISALQLQSMKERLDLKDEVQKILSNIHPVKLITHGLKEIITSPEVKEGLFSLTMGMSAGYVAKKIVVGKSENMIQTIAGNVVGMVVSKNVALHSDQIRSAGMFILKGIFSSRKPSEK
jgi:uncharacterized membrane protein YeaQ/YmgE (transglycosylase-associated protein family)